VGAAFLASTLALAPVQRATAAPFTTANFEGAAGTTGVMPPVSTETVTGITYTARFVVTASTTGAIRGAGDASGRTGFFALDAPADAKLTLERAYFMASVVEAMRPRSVPPPQAVSIVVQDSASGVLATCDQAPADGAGNLVVPLACHVPGARILVTPLPQPGVPVSLPRTGGGWRGDAALAECPTGERSLSLPA